MRPLALAIVCVVGLGCSGAESESAATSTVSTAPPVDESPTESTAPSTPSTIDPGLITPVGFDRVSATITAPDGSSDELCLWLADEPEQRSRGLMAVDDIGDADGMVFVFETPSSRAFTMNNVRIDLSIAFFDAEGSYVDAFEMDACPQTGCQNYPTPEMSYAVETRSGALPMLGLVSGSTLSLGESSC